ncbi:hypothetical protein [Tenacibaculum agarivorans]|uniref:hypothetical protein n=1 Tax=Tenacibaculum agarivorans TaxID=1908389 RepID=UPI00094BB5E8|nr:hypothetical protein [Tenacibaculum agarivorans]
MIKNISNLGKVLDKKGLQSINGAFGKLDLESCSAGNWCPYNQICKCDDNACTSGKCIPA